MLMPASDDPKKDREIFLKILTMDDDGAWLRQKGEIPVKAWRDAAQPNTQEKYFGSRGFLKGISEEEKEFVLAEIWETLSDQRRSKLDATRKRPVSDREAFDAITYSDRIKYCERPEHISGPSPEAWSDINAHLNTNATNLPELINQLGERSFLRKPRVGDAFCGGGSIPFEAARIGCDAFASDLNPVASLLTWAGLNILGGDRDTQEEAIRMQIEAIKRVGEKVTEWGIEHNENGERADALLYCVEVKPQGSDYFIPLAPSWLVGEKTKAVCTWRRIPGLDRLEPEIIITTPDEVKAYKSGKNATAVNGRIVDPFDPTRSWSAESLRGPEGLRRWTNEDIQPRQDDVYQERLYCIRWINKKGERRYAAPNQEDIKRENKVVELLQERFIDWQQKGFIPSKRIPGGDKTEEPIRTRGWSHWHHLFTPRQLLTHGLFAETASSIAISEVAKATCLLELARLANMDSKLCVWHVSPANENGEQTFLNQALNPLSNYSCRPVTMWPKPWAFPPNSSLPTQAKPVVLSSDSREITHECDIWFTDPPYADAVNYHELGEFFLAWIDKQLPEAFPGWIADSRSELAVRGNGEEFKRSMVEVYKNLATQMPSNGIQLVQFTHQDPGVWADLGMILWAAGLKATSAWTIATETSIGGMKKGNYVSGTVCLCLRKRSTEEPGFLFDIYPMVEDEVRLQIASMQALDEGSEPNFNDADYQLAAYAAALKVLTQYSTLDGKNVANEVFAVRSKNEKSDFEQVIERAITIACDELIPKGLSDSWRDLNLIERYYLRAVDIESRGERRKGMYEELARGFGVTDIKPLLKSDKANGTRVHTPSGFGTSLLAPIDGAVTMAAALPRRGRASSSGPHPFAATPLRHLLFAVCETAAADNDPNQGRQYLRDTFGQTYWGRREGMVRLLDWLAALGNSEDTADWAKDSEAARILAGRLRNDDA